MYDLSERITSGSSLGEKAGHNALKSKTTYFTKTLVLPFSETSFHGHWTMKRVQNSYCYCVQQIPNVETAFILRIQDNKAKIKSVYVLILNMST